MPLSSFEMPPQTKANSPLFGFIYCNLLFFASRYANAESSTLCVKACAYDLGKFAFKNTTEDIAPVTTDNVACSQSLAVRSLYYCSAVYCSQGEIVAGLDYENTTCKSSYNITLPSTQSILNGTEDLTTIHQSGKKIKKAVDYPVIPTRAFFDISYRTQVRR
jgi:hypothetical protein